MKDATIVLEFDGGSRGNPGPAGAGWVLRHPEGTVLACGGVWCGVATNNHAEYMGLITALKKAQELGLKRVLVRGDSQLVIFQMIGKYKVRHPKLLPLYEQARQLANGFEKIGFEHVYREGNDLADKLSNKAMDKRGEVDGSELDV